MEPKLTIELVPTTSWYSNVRSQVSAEIWNTIRQEYYRNAKHKCEICGATGIQQGYKHPVECHEIWHYDDTLLTQTLTGMIALCPNCHLTKHPGLANIKNKSHIVLKQLMQVNDMSKREAEEYLRESFVIYRERSKNIYKINTDFINKYLHS